MCDFEWKNHLIKPFPFGIIVWAQLKDVQEIPEKQDDCWMGMSIRCFTPGIGANPKQLSWAHGGWGETENSSLLGFVNDT